MATAFYADESHRLSGVATVQEVEQIRENFHEGLVTFWKTKLKKRPRCIVFDLDYTLWPFILDQHIFLPFQVKNDSNGAKYIYDSQKTRVQAYQDVSTILSTLKYLNSLTGDDELQRVSLAIASRSTAKEEAHELMSLFEWTGAFDCVQIFSGNKQNHMKNIHRELGLGEFKDILFFDDNKMNLKHTSSLGVVGYQLHRKDGLSIAEFKNGLQLYNKQ